MAVETHRPRGRGSTLGYSIVLLGAVRDELFPAVLRVPRRAVGFAVRTADGGEGRRLGVGSEAVPVPWGCHRRGHRLVGLQRGERQSGRGVLAGAVSAWSLTWIGPLLQSAGLGEGESSGLSRIRLEPAPHGAGVLWTLRASRAGHRELSTPAQAEMKLDGQLVSLPVSIVEDPKAVETPSLRARLRQRNDQFTNRCGRSWAPRDNAKSAGRSETLRSGANIAGRGQDPQEIPTRRWSERVSDAGRILPKTEGRERISAWPPGELPDHSDWTVRLRSPSMRQRPPPPPPGWQMEVFEVVPGLFIGTRLAETADYDSLGVDVVIDLEDWDWAWVPSVPLGKVFVSFPMEDEDDVDPKVRDVAAFVASLVGSGRKVLVHCTEGLNRSGVVIARALMEMGRSAPEAIELVRRGRGPSVDGFPALGNEAFIAWLNAEDR